MLFSGKPLLYFVTPEIDDEIDKWTSMILEAVRGGVGIVQIRDKEADDTKIIAAAKLLHPFLKERSVPLIINDRVDIALAVNADGVHLGQSDGKVSKARAILGSQAIIGLSVETLEQAKIEADELPTYIAASPVFSTPTKTDCAQPWGLDGLKRLCAFSSLPVVAIGGINSNNIGEIVKSGARAAAVVSAISQARSPYQASMHLVERMRAQ